MRLRTQLRAIPLLLCCFSGSALAAGLPPLVVSPDLLGGSSPRAPTKPAPAATPAESGQPAAGARPAAKMPASAPAAATQTPAKQPPAQAGAALPQGATEVRAQRIRGTRSVELLAEGDAQLQRDDMLLSADKITYRELDDEAHAEGNVRLTSGQDSMSGPEARLKLEEHLGSFESPVYRIKRQSTQPVQPGEAPREVAGGGSADVMYFEGENQYRLKNATWTTCEASDPDWYLKAKDLHLDYDRDLGTANSATIMFQDVPMLWWPWAEFPLAGQRQSGFLAPTFGMSNKVGLDISAPYYWNIAPNYDATIAPRFMGRRGVQLATEFRYLTPTQHGESRVEWLPRDNITGEERALGSFQHSQVITPSLFALVDWNGVSDKEYFEDLSSRVSVASRANLVRKGVLTYAGSDWWNASATVQSYQTLSGGEPYRLMPQLQLNANRSELPGGTAFAFKGEMVQFDHPDASRPEGSRFTLYPQLSLPFERAGYYVTPKIGLHHTQYDLDRDLTGAKGSITRSLPIFSVDSGLFFERDANLAGRDFVQTLEPRVFYVKTPFRDQSDIPVFDSSRYDFGLAQIFSENQYSGGDRIADSNQVTAAVTSRLIDPESGGERLRATVGQRFYFDDQRVTLPGEEPRTGRRADVLGLFSGYVMQKTWLDSTVQYNPRDNWTERFNMGVRYQPDFAKALNLSYRYSRGRLADESDRIKDLSLSGQWPLGGGWYGVGRVTRSLKEDRVTEAIAGIEYDGGCWVVRTAVHRFATNPDDVTQAVFVQLELNDLTSLGTSPITLLKRSVAGYGKINDPVSNRVFGAE
ncbi:LPS assembly protein LptD [Aromatoleum toluclasticum]|uniref:LPS-assembly protein LptD n=1 Tax=Aromatoleum toluclasticum TaxID=92003 RepID=UPI001D187CAD|nr:LPS-assembly protein LptD [Aromatoleum toluclasticum]MCC4116414.1 LPS assembly protein LptD [Aromatoleum toluclasticum]